jgi:DNA-binding MarR family transcriptional regulator
MTDETKNLFNLFSQLLMYPKFIMALHQSRYQQSGNQRRGPGRVLNLIAQHDGLTNSEIAEILDIRPSSVTAMVNKLAERGFVTKQPLESDRRVTILKVTEAGQAAIDHVQKANDSFSEDLFAGLSSVEKQQLEILLTKMIQNLKAINLDDDRYACWRQYCSEKRHFPSSNNENWGMWKRPRW